MASNFNYEGCFCAKSAWNAMSKGSFYTSDSLSVVSLSKSKLAALKSNFFLLILLELELEFFLFFLFKIHIEFKIRSNWPYGLSFRIFDLRNLYIPLATRLYKIIIWLVRLIRLLLFSWFILNFRCTPTAQLILFLFNNVAPFIWVFIPNVLICSWFLRHRVCGWKLI